MESPGPAYRIVSPRLVLRCWNPGDAPLLKLAVDESLDHLRPWMAWAAEEPKSLAQRVEFLRRARGRFDLGQDFGYGLFTPDETRVVGGSGLHPRAYEGAREIGYWIHPAFINQGLATEAAAALTRVAFEVDQVNRVEIHCAPDNVRSAAVPRKLGYTHEVTRRQTLLQPDGSWRDTMIWTLLRSEYPASPAAGIEISAYGAAGERLL